MKDSQSPDLSLRKVPQQARAKQTWEKILNTTAELLDEVGLDGINTNLIAERADINISAIYKYFPNKYAILSTLAVRLNDTQTQLSLDYIESVDDSIDWKEMIAGMLDAIVDGTQNEKGLIPLQSAMLASPQLKQIYRQSNEEVAKVFLKALEKHGVRLPNKKRKLIGNCVGEIVPAMFDLAVSSGRGYNKKVIDELKRMQIAYISSYTEDV